MSRIDESPYLIHFTKGETLEDAYSNFKKIAREGVLRCGTGFIKASKCCICFTEAPMNCLKNENLFDSKYFDRYSPFGFLFDKKYIAMQGGRHAIYSPPSDLELIPDELIWRYVRYEPSETGNYDFSFEREWRLHENHLVLEPQHVKLVLPSEGWIKRYEEDHLAEEHQMHEDCQCNNQSRRFEYEKLFDKEYAQEIMTACPEPQEMPWMVTGMTQSMELNIELG